MRVCEDCADDCFVDDKGKERLYLICLNQFCKLLVLRPVCSTILYLSSTVLGDLWIVVCIASLRGLSLPFVMGFLRNCMC